MTTLPPFPTDPTTLDMLLSALNPGPEAERTSVEDFLTLMSQLGGSDTEAIAEVLDEGSDEYGRAPVVMMRDPHYHVNSVLEALVLEIQRLRAVLDITPIGGHQ